MTVNSNVYLTLAFVHYQQIMTHNEINKTIKFATHFPPVAQINNARISVILL